MTRNVVLATDPPTSRPRTIMPLTEEDARRLLMAVAGHRLEALYRLALSLGLRRGEVLGLRWADIDFETTTLRVTGTLQRVAGELQRSLPKTKAGTRALLLPPVLVALLIDHQQRQAAERQEMGDHWEDHQLVFPTERGTPMEPSNLNRHFKAALKRAELPHTTRFHDLRHSCATFLIAQGVHPRVVMEILGHSQISLTMNTYGHVLPETQRAATAGVADLFGKPAPEPEAEPEASDTPEAPEEAPQSDEPGDAGRQPEIPTDDGEKRLYNAEGDNLPA